ncbi:MAG TPA: hypothetical protein VNM14_08925 [Planctomycetota bacterium]|jgi:hypothetical protein|nr:hypothetical protein [Planctomycetota bacterium]
MKVIVAALLLAALPLPAQEKASHEYEYWASCKPGSWVKTRMELENQGQKVEFEAVTRLLEVTPEKVTVEMMRRTKSGDRSIDSPPQRTEYKAGDLQKGKIIEERDEEISVAGKTLKCRYFEIETEASDKKGKTLVKAWMTKEIPGGAAKSEITSPQLKGPVRVTALEWEKK